MTKAALLPTLGDPFVDLFWLHFYKTVWADEVDKLYFILNSPMESEVFDYLVKAFVAAPHTQATYTHSNMTHGDALTTVLPLVQEEVIMLIENDAVVFAPGRVKEAFADIESGEFDIVGSDRGSASISLIKRGQEVFDLLEGKNRDRFPHFWPNFFFAKKEWYMKTDLNFDAKNWKAGEIIKELNNWVVEPDNGTDVVVGDTFVWGSIQLMAQNPRVKYINQYHCYVNDADFKAVNQHLWDGRCGWFHYGSISTGTAGMLTDDKGVPLNNRKDPKHPSRFVNGNLAYMFNDSNLSEYQRRVVYWQIAYDFVRQNTTIEKDLPDYTAAYGNAIKRVIQEMGLTPEKLAPQIELYRTLLKI